MKENDKNTEQRWQADNSSRGGAGSSGSGSGSKGGGQGSGGGTGGGRGTGGGAGTGGNQGEVFEKSERVIPLTREDRQIVRNELPPVLPTDADDGAE